jgi:hypothetical protein
MSLIIDRCDLFSFGWAVLACLNVLWLLAVEGRDDWASLRDRFWSTASSGCDLEKKFKISYFF